MALSSAGLFSHLVSTTLTLNLLAWDCQQRTQFCLGEAQEGTDSLRLELEFGGDSLLSEAASTHSKGRGVVLG